MEMKNQQAEKMDGWMDKQKGFDHIGNIAHNFTKVYKMIYLRFRNLS